MRDIEDYTSHYLEHGFEDYLVVYRRKKILEIMRKYSPKNILEIGCGMEPLFSYVDWDVDRYTIYEPSKTFCDNAVKLSKEKDYKINVINAGFEGDNNGNYDFIICSGLLHELEDPAEMVEYIRNSCNKDTIVHINVPNARSFHRLCAYYAGIISDIQEFSEQNIIFQQHSVFTMESLNKMVTEKGLKVVDSGSYFIKPFTHKQMQQMLEEEIITEKVLDGLYALSNDLSDFGAEIFINCQAD